MSNIDHNTGSLSKGKQSHAGQTDRHDKPYLYSKGNKCMLKLKDLFEDVPLDQGINEGRLSGLSSGVSSAEYIVTLS